MLPAGWDETPEVRLCQSVPSSCGYETAGRDRMRRSKNEAWVKRSHEAEPVEGESETDVILRNSVLVIFAEDKLGSDISSRTTYDRHRNQIVRGS